MKYGQVIKNRKDKLRVALIIPELYETAMENDMLIRLYSRLNEINNVWCERTFLPGNDLEKLLKLKDEKIYTLESKTALNEMDLLIFLIEDRLMITNVLNILNLAKIPILKERRKDIFPVVIFSGNDIINTKPLENFADLFILENIEKNIEKLCKKNVEIAPLNIEKKELINILIDENKEKNDTNNLEYKKLLACLVPSISTNTGSNIIHTFRGYDSEHNIYKSEIKCHNIQKRKSEDILKEIKDRIDKTGEKNVTLVTDYFATSDNIKDILFEVTKSKNFENVNIKVKDIGLTKTNLWILPYMLDTYIPTIYVGGVLENSSKELGVGNIKQSIIYIAEQVFKRGFSKIRLKYVIGFPNENYDDLLKIIDVAQSIVNMYETNYPNNLENIIVEIELLNYIDREEITPDKLELKARYIEGQNINKRVKIIKHNSYIDAINRILLDGDKIISCVIYEAWKNGAKYYVSQDTFNIEAWKVAFQKNKINIKECLGEKYEDSSYK